MIKRIKARALRLKSIFVYDKKKGARITRQMNASFSARGMTPKMTITECGKITPLREKERADAF